jgi:hypothetical protein
MVIEWETFCITDSVTYVALHLRDAVDTVCATPQVLSPRRGAANSESDAVQQIRRAMRKRRRKRRRKKRRKKRRKNRRKKRRRRLVKSRN